MSQQDDPFEINHSNVVEEQVDSCRYIILFAFLRHGGYFDDAFT